MFFTDTLYFIYSLRTDGAEEPLESDVCNISRSLTMSLIDFRENRCENTYHWRPCLTVFHNTTLRALTIYVTMSHCMH